MSVVGGMQRLVAGVLAILMMAGLVVAPPAAEAAVQPAEAATESEPTESEPEDDDGGGLWGRIRGMFDRGDPETEEVQAQPARPEGSADAAASRALPSRDKPPVGEALGHQRVRELPGRRSANAKVFALDDGRTQAEVSAHPVHYRDGDEWAEIDTRVRGSDRGRFAFENRANSVASWFGEASDQILHVEHGDAQLTLGVPGASREVTASRDADTVTYSGVLDEAELVYQVVPGGVKESIVLDAPPATGDAEFRFTLDLDGLLARRQADGSIGLFARGGGDKPVLVMPRPFMIDSSTQVSSPADDFSDDVSQTLARQGSAIEIVVTADGDWLRDSERVYPVVIDPTVELAPPPSESQDAMILSDSPDSNFDGNWLVVGGHDQQRHRPEPGEVRPVAHPRGNRDRHRSSGGVLRPDVHHQRQRRPHPGSADHRAVGRRHGDVELVRRCDRSVGPQPGDRGQQRPGRDRGRR